MTGPAITGRVTDLGGVPTLFVMAAEAEYGPALKARFTPLMTGIGPIEAALATGIALSRLAEEGRLPRLVVSLGSAGSARLEQGATIFADNCSSCHGEKGTGDINQGAPNLTDDFWIYGGDDATIFQTVYGGRQGWMPSWETRLTETDRKILALYVQDLGQQAGNPPVPAP